MDVRSPSIPSLTRSRDAPADLVKAAGRWNFEEPRPGGGVHGSVDTASADEPAIGRGDDGVDLESGDVGAQHRNAGAHATAP